MEKWWPLIKEFGIKGNDAAGTIVAQPGPILLPMPSQAILRAQ